MNTIEYRDMVKKADLTQSQLAEVLGITDRTVRKYSSPDTVEPVPKWLVLATKYVIDNELV